jgi:hypothetical protein
MSLKATTPAGSVTGESQGPDLLRSSDRLRWATRDFSHRQGRLDSRLHQIISIREQAREEPHAIAFYFILYLLYDVIITYSLYVAYLHSVNSKVSGGAAGPPWRIERLASKIIHVTTAAMIAVPVEAWYSRILPEFATKRWVYNTATAPAPLSP